MLVLKDRYLLRSGRSLISDERAAELIAFEDGIPDHYCLEARPNTKVYERYMGKSFSISEFEDEIEIPQSKEMMSDLVNRLVDILADSPRYKPEYDNRIMKEIEFFEKTNNVEFLLEIRQMIENFKRDKVVWGVGRGSSCASLVLFLLEVHDINPYHYDIPFNELSKE